MDFRDDVRETELSPDVFPLWVFSVSHHSGHKKDDVIFSTKSAFLHSSKEMR